MKAETQFGSGMDVGLATLFLIIMLVALLPPKTFAGPVATAPPAAEGQRQGERMYREGFLPSGERMQAVVTGDPPLPGTTFTCAGCHLRSGLGSLDEGLYSPAINGAALFKPLKTVAERTGQERSRKDFARSRHRPAYTEVTLAQALRTGIDAGGGTLSQAMPRYQLDSDDVAILISYLKTLSSQFSPGASDSGLKFATVMTEDVSQQERDAMLISLLGFIDNRNRQVRLLKQFKRASKGNLQVMGGNMMTALSQPISLSAWLLKGTPETWRSQLEEYYRTEPVFALIGGVTSGDWKPIHEFSEENRIPCLFPKTDFPVISRTDWYTVYLSKGYYQEGEAAAHYLSSNEENLKGKRVVQIVRATREGEALARGFQEAWHDLGHEEPLTIKLKEGEKLSTAVVRQLLAKVKPGAVALWDGSRAPEEVDEIVADRNRPELVLVSSKYLDKNLWSLKDQVREFTYIARGSTFTENGPDQINIISQILSMALMEMKGNYYRENLLDVIGMLGEMQFQPYGRLSFGQGPRYASKQCYIIQLTRGEKPEVIVKGDAAEF